MRSIVLLSRQSKHFTDAIVDKTVDPDDIGQIVAKIRQGKKTIATLNGSFDLLQAGHLEIIYQAALQADVLIVALNTDRSIQQYKSPLRPIISLEYRLQLLAALWMVDYVTWFDETDPREILKKIQPDVHVNGAEYGETCIEAETVKSFGGRLHFVPRIPGLATSDIIKKILRTCG